MTLPLYATGAIGEQGNFLANFFLGLAFGFVLERAGFGSSRKLAAVFYMRDWAVLRVMFTAIVVAMLGLLYFGGLGWVETEGLNIGPTILGSQIVGGLLLGFGFIIGGWCPGTSVVGAASGKLDAFAYMGGMLFGSLLFGMGYDWIGPLYHWGEMGVQTVPGYLGLQPGSVAAVVVGVALAAFVATERFGNRTLTRRFQLSLSPQSLGAAALGVLAFGLIVGYGMAGRAGANVAATEAASKPSSSPLAAKPAAPGTSSRPKAPLAPAGAVKKFRKGSSCS